jgi:hypothetical protein
MTPWLETLGVCLLALLGYGLGRWISRWRKPFWLIGYILPLALIVVIAATRRYSVLEFIPPWSWLVAGRTEFVLSGLVGAMVLATPLSRLPRAIDRRLVILFLVVIVAVYVAWPFLAPAFNRTYLGSLKTFIPADGVCRQSTDYTCGPAAAVTALRHLGLAADEGRIAIEAYTSTAIGTPPDLLCAALQKHYATNGLVCEYRPFKSLAELKAQGLVLAVIKYSLLEDHYVTVFEVTDTEVLAADPLRGRVTYSIKEFAERWRFVGIVLHRKP